MQASPKRTSSTKMAGSPLPYTQPLTTYMQLYKSYFQHNINNRLQGGSNQTSIDSLCGACIQHTPRPTTLTSRLFNIFVPSVYAAEAALTLEDTGTISEKVAKSIPKIHVSEIEIDEYLAKETGMDRLRDMYSLHVGDQLSPELGLVVDVVQRCGMMSFVLASFFGSIQAKEDFIIKNKHTKFATRLRAKRLYTDAIILGGLKNGAFWLMKTAVFTFLFMGSSQTISVYRNKTSPVDYIIGASLTGALLRMNLGLRGIVAGGIIGSVFGLVGGLLVYGVMLAGNEMQEQRHYWYIHNKILTARETEALQEGARNANPKSEESQQFKTSGVPS